MLEELIAETPSDPELHYFMAMEYASAGDEATAAQRLLDLTRSSQYVPAYLQAGQILNQVNRVDEAIDALRRGMLAAREQGNTHAEGEMAGLLTSIE